MFVALAAIGRKIYQNLIKNKAWMSQTNFSSPLLFCSYKITFWSTQLLTWTLASLLLLAYFLCMHSLSLTFCSTQPTHIAIFYLWLSEFILSSCINFVVHCCFGWCVCIYYLSILSSSPFKWSHLHLYPHFSLFCNQTALKAHESNISHPLPFTFSLLSNLVGTVQWQISCSASIRLVTELSLALFTQNCQALCDVSVLIHTQSHIHTHT